MADRLRGAANGLPRRCAEPGIPVAPGQRAARFCLEPEPAQVRRAREHVRQVLPRWGIAEHTELAQLIVSELVTNAIIHGAGPIDVLLSLAVGELHLAVRDQGPGRPVRRKPTKDDEYGRGLELIDGLLGLHGGTRTVTEHPPDPGKTVHVTICLSGPAPDARWRRPLG